MYFFYLDAQRFVLGHFAVQEAFGHAGFFFDAGGGEDVQVAALVFALAEVFGFYQAFADQGLQAVVDFAQADAKFSGQLALA